MISDKSLKQFRKYSDELKTILLDEQYLLAYSQFDGFSHRLLRAEFVVDYDYNYVLELKAFNHKRITNNESDVYIEKGILKGLELKHIEKLLSSDFNSLRQLYDYEGLAITDIGSQQVFINLDKTTKYIEICDGLSIDCFESKTEKILFELNEYFKSLIEDKYTDWTKKRTTHNSKYKK